MYTKACGQVARQLTLPIEKLALVYALAVAKQHSNGDHLAINA